MREVYHLFERYDRKITIPKTALVVEKNTVKAVNEIIDEVQTKMDDASSKTNFNALIKIDATKVVDIQKVAPLIALSMFTFRNLLTWRLSMVRVQLNENLEDLGYTDEDLNQLEQELKSGGEYKYYTEKGLNLVALNNALNDKIDDFIKRFNVIRENYQKYTVPELPKQKATEVDYRRRFSFSTHITSLAQIYGRCFDEVQKLVSPKYGYNPNPSFQRSFVWDKEKKQKLIISLLNEVPIGSFYVNTSEVDEMNEGAGSVLWDGKQRLHAIDSFLKNEFSIPFNGEEVFYTEIAGLFNIKLSDTSVDLIESFFDTKKELLEAYVLINENLVKHTDEDLEHAKQMLKE